MPKNSPKLNWNVGKVGLKINLSFWTSIETQKPQPNSVAQGSVFVAAAAAAAAKLRSKFCDLIFRTMIRDWLTQFGARVSTAERWKTQRVARNQFNHKGNRQ